MVSEMPKAPHRYVTISENSASASMDLWRYIHISLLLLLLLIKEKSERREMFKASFESKI